MKKRSKHVLNFPAHEVSIGKHKGLKDEDSLIYLAGKTLQKEKVKQFTDLGLHVKFEKVSKKSNDTSMSNYIVLEKNNAHYINIETEHGDLATHKKMIDKVMKIYKKP